MRDDERRLDELFLGRRLEEFQLKHADAVGPEYLDVERRERDTQIVGLCELVQRILRMVAMDRFRHRQAIESVAELDRLALIGDRRRAENLFCDLAHELLGQVHQIVIIPIRLVELEHRELGVMPRRDAFVAKIPVDRENFLEAADHQPLQIELRRDAQVQVHVQRVVMRAKRPRRGAARDRLHHRRLDLEVVARDEELAHRLHDA